MCGTTTTRSHVWSIQRYLTVSFFQRLRKILHESCVRRRVSASYPTMSILATLPWSSPYTTPYAEILMRRLPSWLIPDHPLTGLTHAATVVYFPMFLRIFVQASLGGKRGYDNDNPRRQISLLLGKSKWFDRLHASHINGLESFPFFAVAVLGGLHARVDHKRLCRTTSLWIIIRIMYVCMYCIQTKRTSALRSLLFLYSLGLSMNLLRKSAVKLMNLKNE